MLILRDLGYFDAALFSLVLVLFGGNRGTTTFVVKPPAPRTLFLDLDDS